MKYTLSTDTLKHLFCVGAAFIFIGIPGQVFANEEKDADLEEIVVTASALKVDVPTQETPKSVSIITNEIMETHVPLKLDEALRYTAGITSQPYGSDNDADWFKVRGFNAATYLDGGRLFKDGYYLWLIEPYGLEQIEVVKGPSSILFGESPPGGVINAVLKKPSKRSGGEVRIQAGTNSHRSGAFDIYDSLNDDNSIRFRLVGLAKEEDGELEGAENKRYYLAPSIAMDLSDRTNLTLKATILEDDGIPTNPFFPAAGTLIDSPNGKIGRSHNLGEPDYDTYQRTQISLGYALKHKFNEVFEYSQNFNYGYNKLNLKSSYGFPNSDPLTTTLYRGIVYRNGKTNSFAFDNRGVANWESGRIEHNVLMGIDLQHHKTEGDEQDNYRYGYINPYEPVYGHYIPLNHANDIDREVLKKQASVYSQYQLKFDKKIVGSIGGRYDRVDTENKSDKNSQDETRSDGEFSLNAGLMYIADNGLSPYVSYSESFNVLSTIDRHTNKLYKPLDGEQYEIGLKYTPYFIEGFINIALFDITQKNALVTNPKTFIATQTGEVTSRGLEIEGLVVLSDGFTLKGSYTYTDAKTDNTGGRGSERAALIPETMASAWVDFDGSSIGVHGLKIGTGFRYIGESKDSPASSNLTVPSVTLWDAMASYEIDESWKLQLNVNNIADKTYISGCDYYCYYGQSRSAMLSLSYNW